MNNVHFKKEKHDPQRLLKRLNVIIGRTHRGTVVEINKHVAFADLIIGVGECMPHPIAGYGGSFKPVMPGVCSYRPEYLFVRAREMC